MNDLTIGKWVRLSNEKIRAITSWFIRLVTQHEPDVRNVLFAEPGLATWKQLHAHLQVVVRIEKRIMDRHRVQRDAVFQEFALHFLLYTNEVRAVAQSENGGDLKNMVPLYGTAQVQVGLSIWSDRHGGGSEEQFLEVV